MGNKVNNAATASFLKQKTLTRVSGNASATMFLPEAPAIISYPNNIYADGN